MNSLCKVEIIDVAVLSENTHLKRFVSGGTTGPATVSTAVAVVAFPSSYIKVPIENRDRAVWTGNQLRPETNKRLGGLSF